LKLRAIFDLYESEVSCSFFISEDNERGRDIRESWLKQLSGEIHSDYKTSSYNYSEYTYGTDYDTYLKIGGHDLFVELSSYVDKYCFLKVSLKNISKNAD
jgi:hypothetical protein